MDYVVGVDIGGTFTDCVLLDESGTGTIGKARSTPPDFEIGFLDAMRAAAERRGISLTDLAAHSRGIYHGCTVGTNALVEGRTARVGLLVTAGHRETVYAMGAGGRLRGLPAEQIAHVAAHSKPEPLVPRHLVAEIDERVTFDGHTLVALNEDRARAAIDRLLDSGAEAFAVALLWSVVASDHEDRLAELLAAAAPDAFVSLSHDVVPRVGEYERTIATVVNSLVGPPMIAYLGRLEARLRDIGYRRDLHIMSCSGGLVTAAQARRKPLLTIGSGPVAGVVGSRLLSRDHVVSAEPGGVMTTDMGGTTFDVGVILGGRPLSRPRSRLGQYEYFVPTVDVRSIGAGGGSIVRYDATEGTLRVGPRSAGARPGPAAYLRGGIEATITDADLVLGYVGPRSLLGGEIELSVEAAGEALERAGAPLGFSAEETAAAAARIVDNQMADAIRLVSVDQGYDPRLFTMYAYGGNGPVHSTAVATHLGIGRVLVPLGDFASGWSAFGVAAAEALVVEEAPCAMAHPFDADEINRLWQRLEEAALMQLAGHRVTPDDARLERFAEVRYTAQVTDLRVRAPAGHYTKVEARAIVTEFEREYERLFGPGSGYAAAGFTLTCLVVNARASISDVHLDGDGHAPASRAPRCKETRGVIWYEHGLARVPTPIYDGSTFGPGADVGGPAVIEYADTTLVIRPGQWARVEKSGSVAVTLDGTDG